MLTSFIFSIFILYIEQLCYQHILIIDAKEIYLKDAIPCRNSFAQFVKLMGNFPETQHKIFIINGGWSFTAVWSIAQVILISAN